MPIVSIFVGLLVVMWSIISALFFRRWWGNWWASYQMQRFNKTPLGKKIAFEVARETDREFCFGTHPDMVDPEAMAEFDAFYAPKERELDAEVKAWIESGEFERFLISTRSPIIALWKKRAASYKLE